jgi:plastocyanin
MHSLAVQLAPLIAAEKSKVPFYVAGGVLVAWALILSMAIGMRRPEFPGDLKGQRLVSAVTVVLVIGALSTAIITSGAPSSSAEPIGSHTKGAGNTSTGSQPAEAAPQATGTATTAAPAKTTAAPAKTTAAAPAATTSVSLAAEPGGLLKYNKTTLHAKAGTIAIAFTNMAPVEHNVTVAQSSSVVGATPTFSGGSRTLTLTLKPGTYTFYCSVPGHRQAGMEGKLIVS